jgi:IMP dehydrogenase
MQKSLAITKTRDFFLAVFRAFVIDLKWFRLIRVGVSFMKVRDLLYKKNRPVQTIASHCSIDEAIDLMTAEHATALIVTMNGEPIGIFTERDVFRCCVRNRTTALSSINVQSAMTATLITANSEDNVGNAINVMMKAGVKHLPVVEEKQVLGMLKLDDLVEVQLESLAGEILQLQDYIDDLHEAGLD